MNYDFNLLFSLLFDIFLYFNLQSQGVLYFLISPKNAIVIQVNQLLYMKSIDLFISHQKKNLFIVFFFYLFILKNTHTLYGVNHIVVLINQCVFFGGFEDCGARCKARCSLHSRPKVCIRACGTCCLRCKCVPPGTYGNREMCGRCYTDMITHGNKPKCP